MKGDGGKKMNFVRAPLADTPVWRSACLGAPASASRKALPPRVYPEDFKEAGNAGALLSYNMERTGVSKIFEGFKCGAKPWDYFEPAANSIQVRGAQKAPGSPERPE